MNIRQRVRRIADLRRELSTPPWNRQLFEWHRPSHVVWALVLVFGTLLGGPPVVFALDSHFHLHDPSWFRLIWMSAWMTLFFSVVAPLRRALAVGIAMFVGQCAREWARRAVGDDWRAFVISAIATLVMMMLVVAFFRLRDERNTDAAVASSGRPA